MTERQLVQRWVKKQKGTPGLWLHVLSDTYGGHKKPCDVIGCYMGKFFAIEFKKGAGFLRPHQQTARVDIQFSGGKHFIGNFMPEGLVFSYMISAYPESEFLKIISE